MSLVSLPDMCYVASNVMTVRHVSHPQCYVATIAFIYFKEYEEDKQFLTYPSKKLGETVSAAITLLESKPAKVACMGSVEEKMTVAIKETVVF